MPLRPTRIIAVAVILMMLIIAAGPAAPVTATAAPSAGPGGVRFANYDTGFTGGEPTLGTLPDGSIVAQGMTDVVKTTDMGDTWKDMHTPPSGTVTLDPYIHVDAETGRILSSQLLGACQMLSLSDDGGETWIDVPTQCPAGDHQKIGSGPWKNPLGKLYPRAFYTCLNKVIDTACSMSYDGGLTWTPQILVFPGIDPTADDGVGGIAGFCGGLEGDPVSGPDGTIYLPREYCGRPFVAVSHDDGLTWQRHWVAEPARSLPIAFGGNNPSVSVDSGGTVHYAWTGDDWGHYVSHSKDQGETWSKPRRVSPPGVKSTTFPSIIAGDGGKVATSFIGTSEGPSTPGGVGEKGVWHLYVAYSYNATAAKPRWDVLRVTTHPVQLGCVGRHDAEPCNNGNLLDFNDMAFTKQGRVAISYTDGCLPDECKDHQTSRARRLAVAIQTQGRPFRTLIEKG